MNIKKDRNSYERANFYVKINVILLFSFFCTLMCAGQTKRLIKKFDENSKPVYVFGVVTGRLNNDSLQVVFWKDYIYGATKGGATEFYTAIDNKGKFQFRLPNIDHPARLRLGNYHYGMNILEWQLVEPGDSIQINLNLKGNHPIISFSGKGYTKYKIIPIINDVKDITIWKIKWPHVAIMKEDSIIKEKEKILNLYKRKLTPISYEIIKLDIIGEGYKSLCEMITFSDSNQKMNWENNGSIELFHKADTSKEYIKTLSKWYIEFLFEKTKLELDFIFGNKYDFVELYKKIKNEYRGLLREKLLAYCLLDYVTITNFGGIDAKEFTQCLREAYVLIKTGYLKVAVDKQLKTIGKGASAFDFYLPDSTGKVFSLHDFLGKVVFIDIWSNPCTGCLLFKRAFEKELWFQIKNEPDVVILSISVNPSKTKWLEGIKIYSDPNFINLYTEGYGVDHPLIEHYNITGLPFFLLIDKKGKIFSATVPCIYIGNRSRELLALFDEALNMSDK